MIVEQDRIEQQRNDFKKEKEFRTSVIKKAEVYERLKSNRDFNEFVQDIKNRAQAHKACIDGYSAALGQPVSQENEAEHPIMRRMRCADLIAFHEAQRTVCLEIAGMAENTSALKEEATKRLNEIEQQEKEILNGPA